MNDTIRVQAGGALSPDELPAAPSGRTGWPWTLEAPVPASSPAPPEGGWPKVSIVVPSFRQGHFIEETIRSVLLQGYPNLELIVFDGGSTDGTVDVLRRYDRWIAHWASESDRGQTHAINKGLERATGEIFSYLNSDDLLAPGALHAVVEAFVAEPGADVVHGSCIYTTESGERLFSVRGEVTGLVDYLQIWERLARREFLTQPEVFCRTRVVREAGGFREELQSVMDFEMWLRLLSRGRRFHAIEAPVAHFRTYAAQKSAMDSGDELCRVVEEYAGSSDAITPEMRVRILEGLRRARGHFVIQAAIAASMLDRYPDAVRYCVAAVRARPSMLLHYPLWSVLAHPLKRFLRPSHRGAIRRLLGVAAG